MEHLPFADDVIALDTTGRVVNQAPYSELRLNEVYPKVQVLESVKENHQLPLSDGSETKPIKDKSQDKDSAPHASAHEVTRKTGDLKLYTFYLHSVGPLLFIFWLVFAAGYIFSGKVPRTCHYSYSLAIAHVLNMQRYGFGFGQKMVPQAMRQRILEAI